MSVITSSATGAGASGPAVQYVLHGANASTVRPATSGPVIWIGTVQPLNALSTDLVINTTSPADTLSLGFPLTAGALLPASSASVLTASNCFYMRSFGGGIINSIGIEVVTQSGNIAVAVYGNSGTGTQAVPSGLKATSGSVSCPPVGYAAIPLPNPTTVNAGDWLALACDNTTATFLRGGVSSTPGTALGGGQVYSQAGAFPPPVTPSTLIGNRQNFSLIGNA